MGQFALPAEMIAMHHAFKLAQTSAAPLGPNPRVGCVIMDNSGVYLAEGFHLGVGTKHAEMAAIQSSKSYLSGATAVVTLEPCYRPDRETDCARSLINAGVSRVVIAQPDKTAKSSGGAEFLRSNSIEVIENVAHEEASGINPWFTIAQMQQRPYVRVKIAASLDGKIAAQDGSSKWITGSESRQVVHALREESHCIITSTRTVLTDDAKLTARDALGELRSHQPSVLILGSTPIPTNHVVFSSDHAVALSDEQDLGKILSDLWHDQKLSVLVEAGPKLTTAFLLAGLVNELVWFVAPKLIGSTGKDAIDDIGVSSISDAIQLQLHSTTTIGSDQMLVYRNLAEY